MKSFDRKFGSKFFSEIPKTPGIYLYFNERDEPIYVGRAKDLRRRLGQYRNAKRCKKHEKMRTVVREGHRLEIRPSVSFEEACMVEARLIQDLRPKWNVEGAFYFLYPLVGFQTSKSEIKFCYTRNPDQFKNFELFGAFRSRAITGDAFFALMRLLRFVGHQNGKVLAEKGSYTYCFRNISEKWLKDWSEFLMGNSQNALEQLVLQLVENAAARSRAEEIQDEINVLKRFWRHEVKPLSDTLSKTSHVSYPVSQKERDILFLKRRLARSPNYRERQ